MGKDMWESSTSVKEVFQAASDSTHMDVEKLLFESSEDELKQTDKTQIAMTVVSLSAATVLKERGIEPEGCAGFSLGEYSALVEAGVIALEDVFPLVKARGDIMEKVSRGLAAGGNPPGMAAVIGLSFEKVEELIHSENIEGLYIANYNSPSQIVLSGTGEALDQGEPLCKQAGAKRYIRLKVSAPFHSPLLQPARDEFEEVLNSYSFQEPQKHVYSNVTADRVTTGTEARKLCGEQIVSTVRWVDEEKKILEDGFERCLEVGPGKVLTGLWKAVGGEVRCHMAGTVEQITGLQV
jgi:[acyl-carrier-protein] S-malonyltransferase